jgi:hypothetical protein
MDYVNTTLVARTTTSRKWFEREAYGNNMK